MPYTPPARSPVASAPSTPDGSRRPSLQSGPSSGPSLPALPRSSHSHSHIHNHHSRPSLPRSSSYIQRSRRSPSASEPSTPPVLSVAPSHDTLKAAINSESVRQSPPPVTDGRSMPNGAIISPPDSSDEEGGLEVRARLARPQVQELQQVTSQIPRQRAGLPEHTAAPLPSARSSALDLKVSPPRKHGHVRSVTEPNASSLMASPESSVSTEDESDTDVRLKPQMVRKKSGELVRPALRGSSAHRRPSSMPGTPTFAKAVHFDSHLEHIRHFLQVDRPAAVSAGSSPTDHYESDTEYPFLSVSERQASSSSSRQPPFEWEINARNFPSSMEAVARRAQPVRLEKVWLSPSDQKSLIGSIVVANLAFHKAVVCRFTFDYWKTTSEIVAEYSSPVVPKMTETGHDRFAFAIRLSDTANLESKTLYMCIRYAVDGAEYWDNNGGANFQIDFRKKNLPQNGKNNFQGAASRPAANTLPRSNRRRSSSSASSVSSIPSSSSATAAGAAAASQQPSRPAKPVPSRPDGFGVKSELQFDEHLHEMLGEPGPALRFKAKSMVTLPSDNLSNGLSAPSGQAFAGRYDFGASLRAAKDTPAAAKDRIDDALYMKSGRRDPPVRPPIPSFTLPRQEPATALAAVRPVPEQQQPRRQQQPQQPQPSATQVPAAAAATARPVAFRSAVGGTSSPVAGSGSPLGSNSPSFLLANDSYDELVNKYCFFVPKQSSPTVRSVGFDGPVDGAPSLAGSVGPSHSPVQHAGPAQHHSLPRAAGHGGDGGDGRDALSYFPVYTLKTSPASSPPVGSPVRSLETVSGARPQAGLGASPRTSVALSSGPGAPMRTASSASIVESFQPFGGASPTEEYSFAHHHLQDRFPFSVDAHPATAIRG